MTGENNPQLEDGFTEVANELLDALAKTRIPGEARQVLDYILRKTYGYKKIWDRISLSQFVEGTGLKKPTVCRALVKLHKMNLIIIKKDNGIIEKDNDTITSYCFNKHYANWRPLSKKIIVIKKDNASLSKKIHTKENTTKESTNSRIDLKKPKSILCEKSDKSSKTAFYEKVFEKWNAEKIYVHRKLDDSMKSAIDNALKDYTEEEILRAIGNYGEILRGNKAGKYRFSYHWTLCLFLRRKNALPIFVNTEIVFENLKVKNSEMNKQEQEAQELEKYKARLKKQYERFPPKQGEGL